MLLFVSCKKENEFDCFKSTGSNVTEVRDLGRFDTIRLFENINLNIVIGSEYKVEVVAGKHVIKNITTELKNRVLTIDNNNKCNFVRGYKRHVTINITVPRITKVENRGVGTVDFYGSQDTLLLLAESSGDIHATGIYNEIRTSSHGNGDIYLNGSTNTLYVYTNGVNFLKGENLAITNYVFVETLSIGDCTIDASHAKRLDYHIWESGNIYYTGNDSLVITNVSDGHEKGRLIQK